MQKKTEPPLSWQGATIQELKFWRGVIDAEIAKRDKRQHAPRTSDFSYRNPNNQFEHWGGVGKHPAWLREWLEAGNTLDELRIDKVRDDQGDQGNDQ